jgi:predicted ATP-binding protein involved in virulence
MKVKQLKINSFRGISNLTLDFSPNEPTVFIGDNGVGKSSILDCLAILLSHFIEASSSSLTSQWRSNFRKPNSNKRFLRNQDLKTGCNESFIEIILAFTSKELSWSMKTILQGNSLVTEPLFTELNNPPVRIHSNSGINPLIVYYPVNRVVLDILLDISHENSFDPIDAYEKAVAGEQISFESFFKWFRTLEDLENEERRDNPNYRNEQLEAVRQAISSLMPRIG